MSIHFIQGDARQLPLADNSVHCAVTSPPYWGLRDYGVAGQIGLEPTLAEYLAEMAGVFREVRRVRRPDGTLWLNMGDGFNAKPNQRGVDDVAGWKQASNVGSRSTPSRSESAFKPKDLLMQPHRLAIALQDDGWYVRMDNVWHKPNPMPESVTDRPSKSHEYVFLLSKSERYFYDAEAVREVAKDWGTRERKSFRGGTTDPLLKHSGFKNANSAATGRNLRSVWTMTTRPCKEAHFATFPIDLPMRCIKAGTSEKGCCPNCGAPWRRIIERTAMVIDRSERTHELGRTRSSGTMVSPATCKTVTWLPSCKCPLHAPVPCTVLDIFGGAATTGLAAFELGRHAVIVERKAEYIEIGRRRLANHKPRGVKVKKLREPKPEPTLFNLSSHPTNPKAPAGAGDGI